MNKVKMFFIAAALVLTTAGVFAGKAKFQTATLYYSPSSGSYIALGTPNSEFTTSSTGKSQQAEIRNSVGTATLYPLYLNSGSGYQIAYTIF